MGIIKGICISEKRGTQKHEVSEAKLIADWGIENDAHAGHWHRHSVPEAWRWSLEHSERI